ncbi:hypothetical protein DVA67_000800 [Solirubrobacter sp. CPCC 204708]|uniref:Gram-positive cocci surface proteins LPxTG domain-containing protein n=1 Tax=Solirubrobacter deserti TaxID=2282478 RepID=A0ABT4RU53_9ACTN|nr:hypothetical protein [Solirubrobacter deserti]MBE2314496.1 hypothetical protein [Solirubrobacter deserti]MDA0142103.1 hypothetical protein [Solirubrobacter deserti]
MIRSFALLSLLVLAAPAAAQDCEAPPGTAAIEQYCESVPESTGNRSTRDRNQARGETRTNAGGLPRSEQPDTTPVPETTMREIERAGERGEQLSRVLRGAGKPRADNREPKPTKERDRSPAVQRTPVETPVPVQTGNAFSAVGAAVSGGDTVGGTFPLILLAIAGLIGGAGFIRRGRGGR